jgi:hypothetical protein
MPSRESCVPASTGRLLSLAPRSGSSSMAHPLNSLRVHSRRYLQACSPQACKSPCCCRSQPLRLETPTHRWAPPDDVMSPISSTCATRPRDRPTSPSFLRDSTATAPWPRQRTSSAWSPQTTSATCPSRSGGRTSSSRTLSRWPWPLPASSTLTERMAVPWSRSRPRRLTGSIPNAPRGQGPGERSPAPSRQGPGRTGCPSATA